MMRPPIPELTKILTDAHVEILRGSRPRPATRRTPRTN